MISSWNNKTSLLALIKKLIRKEVKNLPSIISGEITQLDNGNITELKTAIGIINQSQIVSLLHPRKITLPHKHSIETQTSTEVTLTGTAGTYPLVFTTGSPHSHNINKHNTNDVMDDVDYLTIDLYNLKVGDKVIILRCENKFLVIDRIE